MKNFTLKLLTIVALCFSAPVYAGGGGGEKSGGLLDMTQYVELDPIMMPIIDSNGVSQVINIVVALEVDSTSAYRKVEEMQPVLIDAYIQDMYGLLARQTYKNGGALEIKSIKENLLKASNRILSKDGDKQVVKNVLLQMLDQRRI